MINLFKIVVYSTYTNRRFCCINYNLLLQPAVRDEFTMKVHHNSTIKTKDGKIPCSLTELNLGVTLKGGQSFRWCQHNAGYQGVFDGCVWTLTQNETHLFYKVQGPLSEDVDYQEILSNYFRLDLSLEENCKAWALADEHFDKSLSQINGVRILNQDVVENLFSFICSSNNNIQRISSLVEKLCTLFGSSIGIVDGKEYYSFPSIEALSGDSVVTILKREKFGYRAGYIANAAKQLLKLGGRKWLSQLDKENDVVYETAKKELMTLSGVGPKVADCICLMSLGHLESIPIDTHIFQIAKANYLPHLAKCKTVTPQINLEISNHLRKLWGPLAGWAQAVVFCAKINNSTTTQTSKRKNENTKKSNGVRNVKR